MTRFAILNQIAAQSHSFHHGETVQYFRTGEHTPYTYRALVERQYDQIVKEVGELSAPAWIVGIKINTDKTKGITAAEVNTDSDCIALEIHPGEGLVTRQVVKIVSSHAGCIRLLVT
jgi:hypothetical protein